MPRTTKKTTAPVEKHTIPTVPAAEQPYKVPENWRWVRLGEIYVINPHVEGDDSMDVSFVPMEKVNPGMCSDFMFDILPWKQAKKGHTRFANGDIAFAKISPCFENRKAFIATGLLNGIGGGTTELIILRHPKILQKYTYYSIMADRFINGGVQTYSGTVGQQRISMDYVRNYPFPLPPLAEQQRIVDRIESLFAKLDEAREKAQAVVDGFENRKAAILHKAFTGELTKKWREERGIGMEGWNVNILKDCCNIGSGGTPSRKIPEYYNGKIPWVKTGEISWNEIYDTEEHISESALNNSSAKLYKPGVVLVAMYGMGITRGRAAILRNQAATNQAVCVLSPHNNLLNNYLYYYFMCNYWLIREQAVGGNQLNLSGTIIAGFKIHLPPLEEQTEIVRILDSLLDKEQRARDLAESVIAQIDGMKKAILARAFRSELGTNDPSEAACNQ